LGLRRDSGSDRRIERRARPERCARCYFYFRHDLDTLSGAAIFLSDDYGRCTQILPEGGRAGSKVTSRHSEQDNSGPRACGVEQRNGFFFEIVL
jgi:hypothetical protein